MVHHIQHRVSHTFSTTNAAGCDSIATLHLTINHSTTSDETVTASATAFTWNGNPYTTSGVYTFTATNAAGCDSVATLHLTINHGTTSDTTVAACTSFTWNGTPYVTSGVYTFTTTNAAGCDSVATLHLTINHGTTSDTTVVACSSLTWNGTPYTTSGVYTFSTTNSAGCDSVATLHLTINVAPSAPTIAISEGGSATFCAGGNVVLASDSSSGNQWYKGGVLLGGEKRTLSILQKKAVATSVVYTAQNGCTSPQSNAIVVTANPLPTLTSGLTGTTLSEVAFTYTPTSSVAGTTFTWTRTAVPGISNLTANSTGTEGLIIETLIDTIVTAVNVTYEYELTSPAGCLNSQNVVVTVTPLGTRLLTPNKLNLTPTQTAQSTRNRTSNKSKIQIDVTAMPNPTSSSFNLVMKSNDVKTMSVIVSDMYGHAIENHQNIAPGTVLRLGQSWTGGTYIVEVLQGDQRKIIRVVKAN